MGDLACEQVLVLGPGARATKPQEDILSHAKANTKKAALECETHTLEPVCRLRVRYPPKKITNPDWIVIYAMDACSFIQLLNNRARCMRVA